MVRMRPYCIGAARPVRMFRGALDEVFTRRTDKLIAGALHTDDKVTAFSTVTTVATTATATVAAARTARAAA